MTKTPIQEWMNANFPPDTAVYARAAVNQMMYFRDDLHEALCCGSHPDLVQVSVVGQHTSKSTVLPVVLYERSDMQVMVRDNYHNIVISVNRKRANGALKLVDSCSFKFGGFAEGLMTIWAAQSPTTFNQASGVGEFLAYTPPAAIGVGATPSYQGSTAFRNVRPVNGAFTSEPAFAGAWGGRL